MDKNNKIENIIKQFDKTYKDILDSLENISDSKIKSIIVLALIDSIVQDVNNYKFNRDQRRNYVGFLIKYGKDKFKFLDKVDPITLFYELEDNDLNFAFNLDYLEEGIEYSVEELLKISQSVKINNIKEINNRHTYAELIYTYRSKLMHEFVSPTIRVTSNDDKEVPMYIFTTNGWELYFPYGFLKKLFITCKNNYMKECYYKNKEPFNNRINYKNWYEDRKK